MMPSSDAHHLDDARWMRSALMLAMGAEGRTTPNPPVGCVIIKDGRLLGRGATGIGGRPHAETLALTESLAGAGEGVTPNGATGATAFVTLEPCSHKGETLPCADALIDAGIERVVMAMLDPDARVAGRGKARLEAAGVAVQLGVLGGEAEKFLKAYSHHRRTGLPFVAIKLASSLDGKIALSTGESQWISSPEARNFTHLMRSRYDAILTSGATVRADNPTLTHRLDGVESPQPLRVVVAQNLTLDGDKNLYQTVDHGQILYFHSDEFGEIEEFFEEIKSHDIYKKISAEQIPADSHGNASGKPDLLAVMQTLGRRGITSVMVEAGGKFAAELIKQNLAHRLIWARSSGLIGGEGVASIADLGLDTLQKGRIFKRVSTFTIGTDTVEIFDRD